MRQSGDRPPLTFSDGNTTQEVLVGWTLPKPVENMGVERSAALLWPDDTVQNER
jgi:hypothetical protein